MKKLDPMAASGDLIRRIEAGAFLTVKAGEDLNTMTIGWAMIGFIWQRPVCMVAVRDSRHTFPILERAADFTITLPTGDQEEALALCGTRSGRELDKFQACGLKPAPAQRTLPPILDVPGTHLECRICHRAPMDPALLDPALLELYPARDFHTLTFGEITACYETEAR